jgi:putative ABC transport system ATP-binding protein
MDVKQCILQMEDVWKVYVMGKVEVPAVQGIDFCTNKGEYVAITGPSGSGKSTLLNLIGCLDTPTAGRIMLGGVDIELLSENDLARIRRKTIGFVFQTFNLMPSLSAKENVALPMRFDGFPRSAANQKAEALLEMVGLSHRVDHKPSELSGGERQRVAIARALINDPQMILADEPTGNLDTKSGQMVIDLLEGLNKNGMTLIVITHDAGIAGKAKRRLHIVDGRFVDEEAYRNHINNQKQTKGKTK